ncbi:MAG: DALR domain-containing protein, partial [Crocinitomicaceae bacterium]
PHHECEIAQGTASNGKSPVRYWMHGNMLTLNGKKMSKSTGNSILPHELFSGENDLLEKGYDPMTVRFFMMQAHYRSTLDFTSDALSAAEKGYARLVEAMEVLENLKSSNESSMDVPELIAKFYQAMDDDFNTPILVAHLFDAVKYVNSINDGKATISSDDLAALQSEMKSFVENVLGLKPSSSQGETRLKPVMDLVLDLRSEARSNKDWGTSDKIRDGLAAAGIVVKDGKEGSTWN